jgi:hypothetical protein
MAVHALVAATAAGRRLGMAPRESMVCDQVGRTEASLLLLVLPDIPSLLKGGEA